MPTLRLAHRGDWRHAPENSLPALLAALRVPGCDGLEFDVRACRGGVPVLLHDETLARVQGLDRPVAELTVDECAAAGIPTLGEVLAAVPRRAFLDVELKVDPTRATIEVLAAGRGPALERAVISSFEPSALERVAGLVPRWPRWLNAVDLSPATIALAGELGCRAISVEWRAIDEGSLAACRSAGLGVAAWTLRRTATSRRLERLGVVAICAEAAALDG